MKNAYNFQVACEWKRVWNLIVFAIKYAYVLLRQDPENSKEPSYRGFLRRVREIIYLPEMNVYEWQKGRPTDEVIETLKSQGAKIKLLPQEAEQIKMNAGGGNEW